MQAAQTPTLTARLLGDPMPGRFERAQKLREFHRVVDVDPTRDRATRRAAILELLKEGPMAIRAIADRLGADCGLVRNDVERLMDEGSTRRTGSGTGMASTVLWHLRTDATQVNEAAPERPKGNPAVGLCLPLLRDNGPARPIELANALGFSRQRINTVLRYAVGAGVIEKVGSGAGVRYRLTPAGREKAA